MDSRFKAPFGEHQAHNRGGYQMQTRGTYSQRGGRPVVIRDNIQRNRQVFGNDQPDPFLCGGNYNKQIPNQQNDANAQSEPVKREKFGEAKDGQRDNFGQAQLDSKTYKPASKQQNDGDAQIESIKKHEKFGEAKHGQREKVEQKHHDVDKKVTTGWDKSAGHVKYSNQAQKQNDIDIEIQMSKIFKQLKSMSIEALPQKEEANEKAKSEEGFHFDDRFAHENCNNVEQEAHLKKDSKPAVNDYESNFLYLDSRPINLGRRILVPIVNKGVNYAGLLIGEEGATADSIRRMFNCGYAVLGQYTDEPLHIKIRIIAPAIEAYERMHRVLKYLHALFEKAHSGQVPQHHQKVKSKSIAEEDQSPICNQSKSVLDKTFAELLQIEVDKIEAQRDNKLVVAPNTDEFVPKLAVRKNNEFVEDSSINSSMSSFITVHEYPPKSPQHQAILPSAPKIQKPIKVVDVDFSPSNCLNFNGQAKLTVRDEKSNQLIKEANNQIAKYAAVKKDSKEMSLKKKLALELGRIGHSGNGDSGFTEIDTILTSTMRRDISRRCAA